MPKIKVYSLNTLVMNMLFDLEKINTPKERIRFVKMTIKKIKDLDSFKYSRVKWD